MEYEDKNWTFLIENVSLLHLCTVDLIFINFKFENKWEDGLCEGQICRNKFHFFSSVMFFMSTLQ